MHQANDVYLSDLVCGLRIWRRDALILVGAFVFVGILIVLLTPPIYRAEVKLLPVDDGMSQLSIGGALGGIAGIAGVSLGGSGAARESMAILRSRSFIARYIERNGLLPILFEDDWDKGRMSWIESDPAEHPDLQDGVDRFERSVLSIDEDRVTGVVTLAVQWTNPSDAAAWAMGLANAVNHDVRERALQSAEGNVAYLQREIASATIVAVREASAALLERELHKRLLARNSQEVAFKIVDAAAPPKRPVRPRPVLTIALSIVAGCFAAIVWIIAKTFANNPNRVNS